MSTRVTNRPKPVNYYVAVCGTLALLAGCEKAIYWANLPPLQQPRVISDSNDNPAIARGVRLTEKLVSSAPLPASYVFVMTLGYVRSKVPNFTPMFDDRPRAFRCPSKDEPLEPTHTPSAACIVLSEEYLDRLSDDALTAVIAHELGHIEKGHKTWEGAAEPTIAQWEADEAALNRLYRAGYCAGQVIRNAGKEIAEIYARGASHPWQSYSADCGPTESNDKKALDIAVEVNKRGLGYVEKKEFQNAVAAFTDAIKLNPNDASAFYNRGNAYQSLGSYERAIEDYNRAIELAPSHASAFNNRGNAYRRLGNYDRAIQDFEAATKLNPRYVAAFNNRGHALNGKQRYDLALAYFEWAVRLNPSSANHLRVGRQLFYLGLFQESAEAVLRALLLSPRNRSAILWYYLSQARSGGLQIASETLAANSVMITDQKWPLPVIDFYLGKIDQKVLYSAAAVSDDPIKNANQLCETNFYVAQSKIINGSASEAIPLLQAAAKECPTTFVEFHGARTELTRLGF